MPLTILVCLKLIPMVDLRIFLCLGIVGLYSSHQLQFSYVFAQFHFSKDMDPKIMEKLGSVLLSGSKSMTKKSSGLMQSSPPERVVELNRKGKGNAPVNLSLELPISSSFNQKSMSLVFQILFLFCSQVKVVLSWLNKLLTLVFLLLLRKPRPRSSKSRITSN